jgi:hypothetical protein
MIYVKKYWWIVLVIILTGIATWLIKPSPVVTPSTDSLLVHKFDSLKYIKSNDSLVSIIDTLKTQLNIKKLQYAELLKRQKKEKERVVNLPVPELVNEFEGWVGVPVETKFDLDSNASVITPIAGIRTAVVTFIEKDQCLEREMQLVDQNTLLTKTVSKQDTLIKLKDKRIIDLTREYFQSEAEREKAEKETEKANKKVRTKNVIIGILSGVAAVGIVISAVK